MGRLTMRDDAFDAGPDRKLYLPGGLLTKADLPSYLDGTLAGDYGFDPLGLAEAGDLEELKIKELKHCRLSMFAWLGCIFQALATQEGPIANWQSHVADPIHSNVLTNAAKGFSFY